MKSLSFSHVKGGVGKTRCTLVAGFEFSFKRLKTLIIDLDDQLSATKSLVESPEHIDSFLSSNLLLEGKLESCNPVPVNDYLDIIPGSYDLVNVERMDFSVFAIFVENIKRLFSHYDVVLIDPPGAASMRLSATLFASDYFAVPVELDLFCVSALEKIQDEARKVKIYRPDTFFLGVIPNKINGIDYKLGKYIPHRILEKEIYFKLTDYLGAENILPMLCFREVIRTSGLEKSPVWQKPLKQHKEAKREINILFDKILNKMAIDYG